MLESVVFMTTKEEKMETRERNDFLYSEPDDSD